MNIVSDFSRNSKKTENAPLLSRPRQSWGIPGKIRLPKLNIPKLSFKIQTLNPFTDNSVDIKDFIFKKIIPHLNQESVESSIENNGIKAQISWVKTSFSSESILSIQITKTKKSSNPSSQLYQDLNDIIWKIDDKFSCDRINICLMDEQRTDPLVGKIRWYKVPTVDGHLDPVSLANIKARVRQSVKEEDHLRKPTQKSGFIVKENNRWVLASFETGDAPNGHVIQWYKRDLHL